MPAIIVPKKSPTPATPERLVVSAQEAAVMLCVSERTLRNWTNQGKVQARKIGRRVLYPLIPLRELINGSAKQ